MSEPRFPWRVGDDLGDGWTVRAIEQHPEFVTIRARKGARATRFEVTYHEGDRQPWTTARYRVQPAPGEQPVVELLAEVVAALDAFDGEGFGEPFVRRTKVGDGST